MDRADRKEANKLKQLFTDLETQKEQNKKLKKENKQLQSKIKTLTDLIALINVSNNDLGLKNYIIQEIYKIRNFIAG